MTSRRAFLASLVAAVLGRSLFRKPAAPLDFTLWHTVSFPSIDADTGMSIRVIRRWDGQGAWIERMDVVAGFPSLFDPREDLAAQYAALQFDRDAFTLADSEFEHGFAKIGAPLYVPRPRGFPIVHPDGSSHIAVVRG